MKHKNAIQNVSRACLLITSLLSLPLQADEPEKCLKPRYEELPEARGALPVRTKEQMAQIYDCRKKHAKKEKAAKKKGLMAKWCTSPSQNYTKSSLHSIHSLSPNGETIEIENGG